MGHEIKNFNLEPISYNLKGKIRSYYPDFIINDELIIEVKGYHFGKQTEIHRKRMALSKWCKDKEYTPAFIEKAQIPKRYIKKAVKLHYELLSGSR